MEILLYTFYGLIIGVLVSAIIIYRIYSKKIISGIFIIFIVGGMASGGAVVGLITGMVYYYTGVFLPAVFYPSNLLAGHISSIIVYVLMALMIIGQLQYIKPKLPKRRFNQHQSKVIEGIWQKLEARLPEIDEKKKEDKPKSFKEMKSVIYDNFDEAIFFRELEKQPDIVDQYINDLCKYPLKEANLYFKYIIEEDLDALQEAAKLGHLQAIRTQHKLKKQS